MTRKHFLTCILMVCICMVSIVACKKDSTPVELDGSYIGTFTNNGVTTANAVITVGAGDVSVPGGTISLTSINMGQAQSTASLFFLSGCCSANGNIVVTKSGSCALNGTTDFDSFSFNGTRQ
jgi:hypothetical protein